MYYRASSAPCTPNVSPSQRDQHLEDIVKFVNPDIFTVNEMGANPSNHGFVRDFVLNTGGVTKYASAQYSNNSFSSITNMLYYNTEKLGLIGQSSISKDKAGNNLVRIIDLYHLYHKDTNLSAGADTVSFIVAVAHLKAGNSTADALERLEATEAFMEALDQSVNQNNIIFCGDFNFYRSNEPGYQELINYSTVSERLMDPLNQSGSWNNNSAYAAIHTQSTRSSGSGCFSGGGMDDRFDFFLISDEIMNGSEGLSYKLNSYATIGQDGNHFNQSINSGTNSSAPSSIVNALYNFSDHLPIMMKLQAVSNIGIEEHRSLRDNFSCNNPVKEYLQLHLKNSVSENIEVRILDLTGKTVCRSSWLKGSREKTVVMDNLPTGIYLVNVSTPRGESTTQKIIKN